MPCVPRSKRRLEMRELLTSASPDRAEGAPKLLLPHHRRRNIVIFKALFMGNSVSVRYMQSHWTKPLYTTFREKVNYNLRRFLENRRRLHS